MRERWRECSIWSITERQVSVLWTGCHKQTRRAEGLARITLGKKEVRNCACRCTYVHVHMGNEFSIISKCDLLVHECSSHMQVL